MVDDIHHLIEKGEVCYKVGDTIHLRNVLKNGG